MKSKLSKKSQTMLTTLSFRAKSRNLKVSPAYNLTNIIPTPMAGKPALL
ncbi:hypothetical protein KAS50_02460 [bacterium]|nr:hypothetical protein [bacterium]